MESDGRRCGRNGNRTPEKKQKRYYSGKQHCHTMKAMLLEFETGQVICTSLDKGRVHDFKLLKRSRLPFVPSQLCLADKGYQGFGKQHRGACLPTKKPRKQPLPEAEKQHNRDERTTAGSSRTYHPSLQNFSDLFWTLSQSSKAFWLTLKFDCWSAELRTGIYSMIHAGGLIVSRELIAMDKAFASYVTL